MRFLVSWLLCSIGVGLASHLHGHPPDVIVERVYFMGVGIFCAWLTCKVVPSNQQISNREANSTSTDVEAVASKPDHQREKAR